MARMDQIIRTVVTSPRWAADHFEPETAIEHFPAKLDAAQFVDRDQIAIIATANAAQNATSITISALTFTGGYLRIPKSTTLIFAGSKVAVLSADYTGGTTLAVNAIPTAIALNDTSTFSPAVSASPYPGAPGNILSRISVASGTLVGRTYAERDAGTNFGPAVSTDDEVFLTVYDVMDAAVNPNVEFYRHGRAVKENYLPGWRFPANVNGNKLLTDASNSAILTLLRQKYRCIKGVG